MVYLYSLIDFNVSLAKKKKNLRHMMLEFVSLYGSFHVIIS